jgi:trimeric autotransporter adhesin
MSRIQRAGPLALASLSLFVSTVLAQVPTVENFAGTAPVIDRPALQVPLTPYPVAVGPDGNVYIGDGTRNGITRFDPLTGTLTALPGLPGAAALYIDNTRGIVFDGQGNMIVADETGLVFIDVATGSTAQILGHEEIGEDSRGIVLDAAGNLYVADAWGNRVRVVRPTGEVELVAGTGTAGFSGDGGPALLADLDGPSGVAVDAAGNVYISDSYNHRIRMVSATDGTISTVAGTGNYNFNGEGLPALQANIGNPGAIHTLPDGSMLVADLTNSRIRRISGGIVTAFAGNGVHGFSGDGGPATSASLRSVMDIARDSAGNIYLADSGNRRLRRISPSGIITSVAGNGTYNLCGDGGPAAEACFNGATSLAFDGDGNLVVGDLYNARIRKITAGTAQISTVAGTDQDTPYAGDGGLAVNTSLGGQLWSIGVDPAGNMYGVVNWSPRRIYRVDAQTGVISVFAGTGAFGFSGDGGLATAAQFRVPSHIVFDAAGNAYVSDQDTNRVRKIAAGTGIITTIAGSGLTSGPLGDGGPATSASLWVPSSMTFDQAGNLLISDELHCRIRKVDMTTGIISTIAGNGGCNYTGNNIPAVNSAIGRALALDYSPSGELYFATYTQIRKIDAAGIVRTVVGDGLPLNNLTHWPVRSPYGMVFDSAGRLYITGSNVIRRISGLPVPAPQDSTPPVITPNVTGTAGDLGWYRSNVQLTWSVSDAESVVSSTSGCSAVSVTADTAGITFTCSATSDGGTASGSVTIKRDTVAPTLEFGAASPVADASGYHSSDVSFPYTVADALSGVYTTSTGNPVVITGEGLHLTAQVVVTDQAGNSATFTTPEVFIERSPPIITSTVIGTTFFDDWYVTSPQISFAVTDPQSPILSQSGCGATTVTQDTAGLTITCTATSSGGTATASVTVKRDSTPPTVTLGTPSPAPGSNGWYAGAVSIPWTVSDELSGFAFADLPNPIVISEEGTGLTRKLSVRDAARNWITLDTPPINIDFSPPTVQPLVTGTPGNNGWYTGDVEVSWAINEAPQNILASHGCGNSSVTSDTAGVTFSCSVTSGGGTASSSVTIKRDATPPVLSFGTPSPVPNASGWNKTNVSIPFTRSDAISGLASTSTASPLVLSNEGANLIREVVVVDNAGNSATFTSVPRNIDKTVPYAEMESPVDGATYGFYQDVVADIVCEDISLISCTSPTPQGELINTRTAGARTFKITAKDAVGFTTNHTHSFTVEAWLNFGGFQAPASPPPTLNLVARGALVPIRWQLPDGRGGFVTNPASFTSATVGSLTCGSATSVPLNDSASGPAGISFDAATNSFVYNWQTSTSWTGCRKLTIKLRDNSVHELRFRFQ